ncbi:MAG TPA: hypothetical protein VF160_04240 [Candidatus Dormibacteraeota bacterium]
MRSSQAVAESRPRVTGLGLIRASGLAALAAGIIFAGIQPIHPPDTLASVTTRAWAVITPLKTAMCMLFLLGIGGLYARQVDQAGWLGLAGFLLLSLSWTLQTAFVFAEAFVLPPLATLDPNFVDGVLGIASGRDSELNLGALPPLYAVVGVTYIVGGLVFGIATWGAGILSRRAAGLLAVAAALTPVAAVVPHQVGRLAAVPTAVAVAWLGYGLWSERR